MKKGKKRWVIIEVPKNKGIAAFKKEIDPFIRTCAYHIYDEWDDDDHSKVKIWHMSERPVPVGSLRKTKSELKKLEEDYHYEKESLRKRKAELKLIEEVSHYIKDDLLITINKLAKKLEEVSHHKKDSLRKKETELKKIRELSYYIKDNLIKTINELTEKLERISYFNSGGKLKYPDHFKKILEMQMNKGYGPFVKLLDGVHKQQYIDIGKTRLTKRNWIELTEKIIPEINKQILLLPAARKGPGRCVKCGDKIPAERLKIVPGTNLCTGCKSAEEQ